MWEKAKKSEAISGFFEKSGIDGDFSSITYLKYFLKGLNKNQLSHENKKLSILLEHLEESIRKKVLIITKDSYNFKVYKDLLEGIEGKEIIIDGFVSELKALNFVKTYTIDLLIVDEELDQMDVDKFIKDFRKIENIKTHNFKILLMAEQVTREIVAKAKKIKINAILSQDPEEDDFKQKILKLIY
jgi:CheY-like chemotaxis protein